MIDLTTPFLEKGEKVVCFGDSLTYGENSYVKYLRQLLPDNTFINAGRGGDKTPWALTRFQSDVLDQKPDALFVLLGANDAAVGRECWADEPIVSSEAFRCNLVWMAHLCRLNGISKISIATPFGMEGAAYTAHGDILRDYYQAARTAADDARARLVPLDVLFCELRKGAPLSDCLITRDGLHPLAESHEHIARAIVKAWKMEK
jgi:lysophospholipase L1-like esterase